MAIPTDAPQPRACVAQAEEPAVVHRLEPGDRALFERLHRTMPRVEVLALREEVLAELRDRGGAAAAEAVERAMKERAVRRLLGPIRLQKYEAG